MQDSSCEATATKRVTKKTGIVTEMSLATQVWLESRSVFATSNLPLTGSAPRGRLDRNLVSWRTDGWICFSLIRCFDVRISAKQMHWFNQFQLNGSIFVQSCRHAGYPQKQHGIPTNSIWKICNINSMWWFPKLGVPQSSIFHGIFPNKPSIVGYLHLWKGRYDPYGKNFRGRSWVCRSFTCCRSDRAWGFTTPKETPPRIRVYLEDHPT